MIVLPPINTVDPQKAYKRMISRPAVKALCAIGDRYVLLKLKDGTYKLPGGGVDTGEDELVALSRELQEECGIPELKSIRLAFHINEYTGINLPMNILFFIPEFISYVNFLKIKSHSIGWRDYEIYEYIR